MGRSSRRQRPQGRNAEDLSETLLAHFRALVGADAEDLLSSLENTPPVSIRSDPQKWSWVGEDPVAWCPGAWYLPERPAFTFDPLLHAGCYYVQEASSMLLEQALKSTGTMGRDLVALDLCAAPGGKSTHLRSLLSPDSLLVANEVDHKRRGILCENLWKSGSSNVVIAGSRAQDLLGLPEFFDLILVDAPCSGQGMFRKDPFAREQWSPTLVEQCSRVQRDIVAHAYRALAPGGTLIYSTCTWEVLENEAHIAELLELGATSLPIPVEATWGIEPSMVTGIHALRCYPHRTRGEGFFLSAVRKPGDAAGRRPYREQATRTKGGDVGMALSNHGSWTLVEQEGTRYAIDPRWMDEVRSLRTALRIQAPGLPYSEPKGRGTRYHPALALAKDLDHEHIQRLPLDLEGAVRYLQGHGLPGVGAKEAALVTYLGHGLGWVQGAGNRWNNLYPNAWRIRSRDPSAPDVSWARSSTPGADRPLHPNSP